MTWNDCLVKSRRIAARTMGPETFIVSPWDNTLHLLPNEVGTRIWELADGQRTLRQIHEQICLEYEVDPAEAEADLFQFAGALVAKGVAAVQPCRQDDVV